MRKTFLLGGVALLIAAVSMAGQRTRGSERALRGDAGEPTANFIEVAPGVAEVTTVNGFTATIRADGSVLYDEVIGEFETVERLAVEMTMTAVPNTTAADGNRMFADGSVAYFSDLVGSNGPDIFSVESHQQEVQWMEVGSGPTRQILFADGVVTTSTSPEELPLSRDGIPNFPNGPETLYADGVVIAE